MYYYSNYLLSFLFFSFSISWIYFYNFIGFFLLGFFIFFDLHSLFPVLMIYLPCLDQHLSLKSSPFSFFASAVIETYLQFLSFNQAHRQRVAFKSVGKLVRICALKLVHINYHRVRRGKWFSGVRWRRACIFKNHFEKFISAVIIIWPQYWPLRNITFLVNDVVNLFLNNCLWNLQSSCNKNGVVKTIF